MDSRDGLAAPRGARDLLPPACRRRREIVRALVDTFERWGYAPVATPLVESFETLGRGLSEADRARCVRFIEAGSGELVALRSDVTPQIARMIARRHGGELPADAVHRFCYAADVVRQPTAEREQTEHHQVGVELVGDGDPAADVELVALADEALRHLGLATHRIDLAHGRIANAMVESLELSAEGLADVHGRLARKDRGGVIAVLAAHGIVGPRADAIAMLCDLYGPPALLQRAAATLGRVADRSRGLGELQAVVDGLARGPHADVCARITVDLGEVRGFDYYTGLRVRVWAPGIHRPIVRGGRYDHLLARYGEPRPATGFAIDLDALEAALGEHGRDAIQPAGHLVALAPGCGDAEARRQAEAIAAARRGTGARAWVQIAPDPAVDRDVALARARSVAEAADADALSWIEPDGQGGLQVVHSTRTAAGWRTIAPESEEP